MVTNYIDNVTYVTYSFLFVVLVSQTLFSVIRYSIEVSLLESKQFQCMWFYMKTIIKLLELN